MNTSLENAIKYFKDALTKEGIDPAKGLGEDLFLFISTLTPMPNVDLLVTGENGILLSWRDDVCGQGWHIPGGIIRYQETLEQRLHATAISELGCDATFEDEPFKIVEIIKTDISYKGWPEECRGHALSLLYKCSVDEKLLKNCDGKKISGHLGWFDQVPENFLESQDVYRETLNGYFGSIHYR